MGQIGFEAKGIVRAEIRNLKSMQDTSMAVYVANKIDDITKPFQNGKRISERDRQSVERIFDSMSIPNITFQNTFVYAEVQSMTFVSDTDQYDDVMLRLRAMHILATRRRAAFKDHTVGVEFSTHALGRIVERAGIKEAVLETTFAHGLEMIPYLIPFPLFDEVSRFVAPFMDGIVLGEKVILEEGAHPALHYVSDEGGCGLKDHGMFTIFDHPSEPIVTAYRINTYLDWNALSDQQERLLASLKGAFAGLENLKFKILRAAFVPPLIEKLTETEDLNILLDRFQQIIATDLWQNATKF